MPSLTFIDNTVSEIEIPKELLKGKRHLTPSEISVLEDNLNTNEDGCWENVYVDDDKWGFDPTLITKSHFSGFVILGRLWPAILKYHDLHLKTGINNSKLHNVVLGNDNTITNVFYLENYRLGDRVILFNIQEMSCTRHSKFGNGILKENEPESNRVQIAVGNENGGREIMPFEKMLPSDAYLWSKFRGDKILLEKFKEFTEKDFSKSLDTYGTVGDDTVIKNTTLIKDAKIGSNCYIKGAFKLKNVTILSNPDEVSQIGEGVEMVNGIMQEGSRVFYQAVAVRFLIGRNCQLKYGARLLNSVLGDNSTVSCCELLNNLIYPFHEQHHNSSFLISTTIMGQSNIAAGATIGSNHNSRSPDGEIIAGRGFWPGLCSNFKHNSYFASFILASKGSYQHELNVTYPFSLLAPGNSNDSPVTIIPAWWFRYNTYAISRNNYKFQARDKRITKIQHIETNPLAPDTIQEITNALDKIITLTSQKLPELCPECLTGKETKEELLIKAKNLLHTDPDKVAQLFDPDCQKKYGAIIYKPGKAYKTYRKIIKLFIAQSLCEYLEKEKIDLFTKDVIKNKIQKIPLYNKWRNIGGQMIPEKLLNNLFAKIKDGNINNWDEVHAFYDKCQKNYTDFKASYSISLLEKLFSTPYENLTAKQINNFTNDVYSISQEIFTASYKSREKDFTDFYRKITFDSQEEMKAVLGSIESNEFLNKLKQDTDDFNAKIEKLFKEL